MLFKRNPIPLPGESTMNVEALLQNFERFGALVTLGALQGAGSAAAAGRRGGHRTFLAGDALPHCFVSARHAVRVRFYI